MSERASDWERFVVDAHEAAGEQPSARRDGGVGGGSGRPPDALGDEDATETGYKFPLTKTKDEVLADFRKIAEPDEPSGG